MARYGKMMAEVVGPILEESRRQQNVIHTIAEEEKDKCILVGAGARAGISQENIELLMYIAYGKKPADASQFDVNIHPAFRKKVAALLREARINEIKDTPGSYSRLKEFAEGELQQLIAGQRSVLFSSAHTTSGMTR